MIIRFKVNLSVIFYLMLVLLATACNEELVILTPTTSRLPDTSAVTRIQTDVAINAPAIINTPSSFPTATPVSTLASTVFPEFYSIMGIWEGTGIAGTLFGSVETKRHIEVRSNCVDNNPCVDVYHLDRDATYLALPYNSSLSIGTTHCFGGYDSDSKNGTEYSICLSPQSNSSLEFIEGDASFSGDGILQKVEE